MTLTHTLVDSKIQLEWNWNSPPPSSATYGYTLYQWNEITGIWQSSSTNYDKTIRVLNVYPDLAASNSLQDWMDDPNIGLGKILVTPVSITAFNANPDNYLKNGSGDYIYDVIMFGSWDSNNFLDLNATSANVVRAFLDSGRGVLFGHDTQANGDLCVQPHFSSLSDKTNLDIDLIIDRRYLWRGGTVIKVINDGFLLKYPHFIPYDANLTIPYTHTTGQTAKGIVWMNFPVASGEFTAPVQIVNGGTNDFYLTTWNNAAMIQTGHANGTSTLDERKIIANTLWYLSQYTTETTAEVPVPDLTPPIPPAANRLSSNCSEIAIVSFDNVGTFYRFYVKATNMEDSSDTCHSDTLTIQNRTGLRGFFISEDNNPAGSPTIVRDDSGNITTPLTIATTDYVSEAYIIQDLSLYIHIVAVDHADNLSEVTTIAPIPFTATSITVNNTNICAGQAGTLTIDSPEAGATYTWYDATGETRLHTGNSYTTPALSSSTSYVVKMADSYCRVASTTVTVTVTPSPVLNLTNNVTICSGEDFTVTASTNDNNDVIEWYKDPSYLEMIASAASFIATPTSDTVFYVKASSSHSCTEQDSLSITVAKPPSVKAMADLQMCYGEEITLITEEADGDISWNTGSTTVALTASTYFVVTADRPPCPSVSDTVYITVRESLYIEPPTLPPFQYDKYYEQQLQTDAVSPYFSIISGQLPAGITLHSDGLINGTASLAQNLQQSYTFTVMVVDGLCSASNTYYLYATLFIPTVFSPNDDGVNDYFMKGYKVTIFDRLGVKIFEGDNGWDGNYNNKEAPLDTYFYILYYNDSNGKELHETGSITLIR